MLSERLLSLLLEFRAAGDVIIHGMKGEKMKKWIVVSGVLAVFLFAAFAAYAAGNSTWGRIKVTFEDGSADELPAVAAKRAKDNGMGNFDAAAYAECAAGYGFDPVVLRKPLKKEEWRTSTGHITVAQGGQVTISRGSTKIRIKFPANSVPYDTDITLTLLDPEAMDLEIRPSIRLNEPAQLWAKGAMIVPDGGIDLYHFEEDDNNWSSEDPAAIETFEEGGTQMFRIRANTKLKLKHFSRYAFGSRW